VDLVSHPSRSQRDRTGREDRRLKFYELRDNLMWREFLDWTEARGYALDVEWLSWEIERLEAGLGT